MYMYIIITLNFQKYIATPPPKKKINKINFLPCV